MEITVKKEDPHESRYNSLNKHQSMMTLDRKWNQVHFDQETKPTEFKV